MTSTERTRHAIARSSGAATLARKGEGGWLVSCLSHSASAEPTESRNAAWRLASHPAEWCSKCGVIAKGKADKIIGDKVAVPAAKKAPAKRAAKKAATA
jgi:hypothetical protein